MAALLITPASAARHWTDRLTPMLFLAGIFGAFSGLGGAFISYAAPAMPTGPWIVVFISLIALVSFLAAPRKGIIARVLRQQRHQHKMLLENILKAFYQLGEQDGDFLAFRSPEALYSQRAFKPAGLNRGLKKLKRKQLVTSQVGKWALTQAGHKQGARITRLHRLWELYLNEYVRIAPDHVHEDAEGIEHVITPEIEAKLQDLMNYPVSDPHETRIPQQHKTR